MTYTPRLGLPYLQSNQAQKHVTLNDALRRMDTLVQLCVNSAEVAEQPESPSEGDVYIHPAGADAAPRRGRLQPSSTGLGNSYCRGPA